MPLLGGRRLDEELHLHLLELAGAEDEVARGDLVAKALADLPDTERRLLARGRHHVGEVDEDALRGLGTQIVQPLLGLDRSEVGLEHHVELARLGPLARARRSPGQTDIGHGTELGGDARSWPRRPHAGGRRDSGCGSDQRLDQRVVENLDVAGGDPHLPRQDDRRIESHDVVAAGDHRAPPLPFDVLFELHAQRPVIPRRFGAAVDLARGKDEAPPFGQVDYGVDDGRHGVVHSLSGIEADSVRRRTAARKTSVMVATGAAVFDMRHHACDSGGQPIALSNGGIPLSGTSRGDDSRHGDVFLNADGRRWRRWNG